MCLNLKQFQKKIFIKNISEDPTTDTQASYIIPKFITMTLTPISEEKAFCLSQAWNKLS